MQMRMEKKAFAYRVPIGDYNYLQCVQRVQSAEWSTSSLLPPLPKRDQIQDFVGHEMLMLDIPSAHKLLLAR